MAVQKSRKTPSKRNMRRSHDALKSATLSVDSVTGKLHRRHHVDINTGYYRGKKLILNVGESENISPPSKRGSPPIACPKNFSLRENFTGVAEVLHQIRTQSQQQRNKHPSYIDFRAIRTLSPAAALVLAAELYRWNTLPLQKGRLKPVDVSEWDSQIRRLLGDMGFFDLLQVKKLPTSDADEKVRYVKFQTGRKADGEAIESLRRKNLDPVVGEMPGKVHLYAAVTEAMTNVVHHAYKSARDDLVPWRLPNWWLSASYDANQREVAILIYDQGVGIPETLPRKFPEKIMGIARTDHAKMIETAHDLSRSASEEQHRGHGLQRDVRAYLEKLDCRGQYRVVSLKGEYIYEQKADGSRSQYLKNHDISLPGTLIEWRLCLTNEH